MAEADASEVRSRALKLLARREHAPVELARKLTERGYPQPLIAAVVAELGDQGLLSEHRYAEALIRARADRGYGPLRLRAELASRGVGDATVDAALAAAAVDWPALASAARRKRFGSKPPEDFPAKARQMRFLQQRGFSGEHIRSAVEG